MEIEAEPAKAPVVPEPKLSDLQNLFKSAVSDVLSNVILSSNFDAVIYNDKERNLELITNGNKITICGVNRGMYSNYAKYLRGKGLHILE